jgi:hypothetical protein
VVTSNNRAPIPIPYFITETSCVLAVKIATAAGGMHDEIKNREQLIQKLQSGRKRNGARPLLGKADSPDDYFKTSVL